jgi:predicted metal-dependent peptidase
MNDIVLGTIANWPKLKLTAAHVQPWEHTRAAALWVLPHITDVWYAMMVDEQGETAWFTDQIDTCATDGKYMYINPHFLFAHPLEERVFICAHEVMHDIFDHCGIGYRLGKAGKVTYPDGDVLLFIPDLFNIATDCLINVILVESKVGGMPKSAWYQPKIIKSDMNCLEAYRTLYKLWVVEIDPPPGDEPNDEEGDEPKDGDRPGEPCDDDDDGDKPGKGKKPGKYKGGKLKVVRVPKGQEGKSFDKHLKPGEGRGKTPADAESERNPQEWDDAVNAAMISAQKAGRLPANLEKIFRIHMEVPTDWRDEMMINFSQAIGREGHTWSYLDGEFALRGIGFPGRVRHGCNLVAVMFDTSGSMWTQETIDMVASNMAAIISQVHPKEILFGECDTDIKRWEFIQDMEDLKARVEGGGGTSVLPPFKRIEEEGLTPDVLIYFTDLEVWDGFPAEPEYPVIWGCVLPDMQAPFGKTIFIPPLKHNPEIDA